MDQRATISKQKANQFTVSFVADNGMTIEFNVKMNRIKVSHDNWHKLLTDDQQLDVFNLILAKYRQNSLGSDGFKAAAIGMTPGKHDGEKLLFIAVNTQRQSPFYKDCAEVNLVNTISDMISFTDKLPGTAPKLEALYLMAGHESKDKGPKEVRHAVLPCGKCTDMLRDVMPEDGKIVAIPVNDGKERITINKGAQFLDEVVPGVEAWQTTAGRLSKHFHEHISKQEQDFQQQGVAVLMSPSPIIVSNTVDALVRDPQALKSAAATNNPALYFFEQLLPERLSQLVKRLAGGESINPDSLHPTESLALLGIKAAENAMMDRDSIPILDINHSPESINHYMMQRIQKAFYERARKDDGSIDAKAVDKVRCALIQLEDGTYHCAVEVVGPKDKATPCAEVTALASSRIVNKAPTHVWVSECCPEEILAASQRQDAHLMMHTSPKEGVERLFKRRPQEGCIEFHFIPFNTGQLERKAVEQMMASHTYKDFEIFPSYFTGNTERGGSMALELARSRGGSTHGK